MKKMILMAIGMFLAMAGFGQFSFGVQAIGNLSNASIKTVPDMGFRKTMKVLPGAGIVAQYNLSDKFAIRSGINYLQSGVDLKATFDPTVNLRVKAGNRLHYLQVPVNVLYNIPAGNIKLYAGAGGYISYGIRGESTQTTSYNMPDGHQSVTVEKLKAFKKEEQGGAGLKKVDAGAGVLAGIRLNNGMFANVGYQLSLANISEGEGKYKNHGLQLSAGYFF